MQYYDGIFINFIRTCPTEMDRMFQAVEYVIKHGSGGDILDEISRKSFKDTHDDYFNRIKSEALTREDGLFIIYKALVKWYETWKDSFSSFNINNSSVKYKEQPIHTWLHCFLTGQLNIYQNLIGEEYVLIEKSKWEETKKGVNKANRSPIIPQKEINPKDDVKIQRLLKLFEFDEELKIKELLLNKKIALFLEDHWTEEQLDEIKMKYHLKMIRQYSSIDPSKDIGIFDYYLFLTSKASHSAKYKLESRIPRESLFLISSTNYKNVMKQFIEQLKGRIE